MGKGSKDKRDIYYRKAKEAGWRARSAFKLLQLDASLGVLEGAQPAPFGFLLCGACALPTAWRAHHSMASGGVGVPLSHPRAVRQLHLAACEWLL